MKSSSTNGESRVGRYSRVVWLTAIVLAGLLVMSRSKADPDLWGHVQYGKEVIYDGHLHSTTTWSYAVQGYRWINHENVAELLFAAADTAGGQTGLLLLKSVLTILLLGLPLCYARRCGAGLATSAVVGWRGCPGYFISLAHSASHAELRERRRTHLSAGDRRAGCREASFR